MSIKKYLPIGSFFHWHDNFMDKVRTQKKLYVSDFVKGGLHLTGAVVVGAGLLITALDYTIDAQNSGTLNPFRQQEILERKDKLYNDIFGENGLADTTNDGKVSLAEKVTILEKEGLENLVHFPFPYRFDLETLTKIKESLTK